MYLENLGFNEEVINTMKKNIPELAIKKIEENEEMVTANIRYLMDLGINNYVDAFIRFYNIFLIDNQTFDEIFSKYDSEDLIAKLEKNVAIMEYL